jgi:hypothetical protein
LLPAAAVAAALLGELLMVAVAAVLVDLELERIFLQLVERLIPSQLEPEALVVHHLQFVVPMGLILFFQPSHLLVVAAEVQLKTLLILYITAILEALVAAAPVPVTLLAVLEVLVTLHLSVHLKVIMAAVNQIRIQMQAVVVEVRVPLGQMLPQLWVVMVVQGPHHQYLVHL